MKNSGRIAHLCMVAGFTLALTSSPGYAAQDVTAAELQAIVQTLGFLSTLPSAGTLNIATVYAQDQGGSEARAAQAAMMLDTIRGPNQRVLRGTAITVKDLSQTTQSFDAYLLMPGTSGQGATISDIVRRRHVVSISTDPACLDTNCCVLMVSAQGRVRIVLDTALADSAGRALFIHFCDDVTRK